MTKREAIELMVSRDFASVPTEWVQIVSEAKGEDIYAWPMWGTMWIVDDFIGERLMAHAEEEGCKKHDEYSDGCSNCEDSDEEMRGAMNIKSTSAYIYEVDGVYVVGVNGAGWDFYDGIWDRLYDILGLQWHDGGENKPA